MGAQNSAPVSSLPVLMGSLKFSLVIVATESSLKKFFQSCRSSNRCRPAGIPIVICELCFSAYTGFSLTAERLLGSISLSSGSSMEGKTFFIPFKPEYEYFSKVFSSGIVENIFFLSLKRLNPDLFLFTNLWTS